MSHTAYLTALRPVAPASADGAARQLLDQAREQVGFIPNMYANMANAPAVLSTYLHGYARFRTESGLTPPEQEVILLAISAANGCDYCMAAHSMIADKKSGVPAGVLAAVRAGQAIPDARLAALHAFATEMVRSQGRPSAQALAAFRDAGFEDRDALYVVLAIAVKTLSNYTNHAFATELDGVFAPYRLG